MENTALHAMLRGERMRRKWSQRMVAERLGVSQQRVTQVENGEKPSPDLLKKMADLYGVEFSELLALSVTRDQQVTKQEKELLDAVRSKDIRRTMRLVESLIYTQPAI